MSRKNLGLEKLMKEADENNYRAFYHLGLLYLRGQVVTQNYAEAAMWFAKAVEHGHVDSIYNLAELYHVGNGVEKNYEKRNELWKLATSLTKKVA